MASRFALEPLPKWWPREPIFHGTTLRALKSIQKNGLCAPRAERASFDDYGWEEVWAEEVYASYKRLSRAQQLRFHAMLGAPTDLKMTKALLGSSVSLWWVSADVHVVEGYEVVTEVDLSKLDYYWWLRDDVRGESSFVLVLPTSCPQAPGSILRRV
jgi:hypothetical protein